MHVTSTVVTFLASVTVAMSAASAGPAASDTSPAAGRPSHACSPAVSIEGFSDGLNKTAYQGAFVGNLSALAVDRHGHIAALSDRSLLFTLDRTTLRPRGSVIALADENGAALDSEGLVIDSTGTRIVSSETEPSIRRYRRDGTLLGSLPVPEMLKAAPAGRATANLTFEGLTQFPGGRRLLASMEGSLSGDTTGILRLQTWQRHGQHNFHLTAQYGYRTDAGLQVSEVTGLHDGRLLVLERGFTQGVGNTVRLYLADLSHATDTAGVEWLTGEDRVRLARKTLLADLVNCPPLGAQTNVPQANPLLDNIEGQAITGRSRGRLELLLVSDDNENPGQTTRLYRLAVRLPRS